MSSVLFYYNKQARMNLEKKTREEEKMKIPQTNAKARIS
jgi:hypothetical protein